MPSRVILKLSQAEAAELYVMAIGGFADGDGYQLNSVDPSGEERKAAAVYEKAINKLQAARYLARDKDLAKAKGGVK